MKKLPSAILTLSALVSACGGGGGGSSSPANDPVSSTPVVITTPSNNASLREISGDCRFTQNLGAPRNDNLRISSVSWLQSVQLNSDAPDTRLAGGKAVKMRIDVLASNSPLTPVVRNIRVYDPDTATCTTLPVSAPYRVPGSINTRDLNSAMTADIPANLVKPGMSVALWLDDGAGRSASEADATYRILTPRVAPIIEETVRIIPIRLLGTTGNINSAADIESLLERLYPVSKVNVVSAPAFDVGGLLTGLLSGNGGLLSGTIGQMQNLLDLLDDRCAALNGRQSSARSAPKCIGMLPNNLIFNSSSGSGQVVGLAYVGGTTLLARAVTTVDNLGVNSPYSGNHWINFNAMTLAHEFGHLMDLDHAACGGATGLDPRLYSDGQLGNGAGYDAVRGAYFSSANTDEFADVMSYCGKEWMSDRGYLAAMAYRNGTASIAARTTGESDQWLKISLGATGWKIRRSNFAPSTLAPSDLIVTVSSERGQEALALRSAVVSEHHETESFGPFFINLGDRQVSSLSLSANGVALTSFSAEAF